MWDFGDGGEAGGPKATHTFTAPGSYTVSVTVTDAAGASGVATLTVVVAAPQIVAAGAPAAAAPAPRAAIVAVRPVSVRAFARNGLVASVRCGAAGEARASLWVSRAAARRLGLASRRIGKRAVTCAAGETVAVRVRPSRAARTRLAGRKRALRISVRVATEGAGTVRRGVRLRAGR